MAQTEAVAQRCSVRRGFFKTSQNSQENTCVRVSFLISCRPQASGIKTGTLAQVLSCEFCEYSKHTFSCRSPSVAASGQRLVESLKQNLKLIKLYNTESLTVQVYSDTVVRRCSVKKVFLKISQKFTGKPLCWRFFLIKLQTESYFIEHLQTATSRYC